MDTDLLSLTDTTYDLLLQLILRHNTPTADHRAGLYQIAKALVLKGAGREPGRHCIAAMTGYGKTSAIAAYIVALHRHGSLEERPLLVTQQVVKSLYDLRDEVAALDPVAAKSIGIRHGYGFGAHDLVTSKADEPSIAKGTEQRYPVLGIAHARFQTGDDIDSIQKFDDLRRLVVFDESFFRAEGIGFYARTLIGDAKGVLALAEAAKVAHPGIGWLASVVKALENIGDERYVAMPELDAALVQSALSTMWRLRRDRVSDTLHGAIQALPGQRVRLLHGTAPGADTVLQFQSLVHPDIDNVVVFDASYRVRQLLALDDTLVDAEACGLIELVKPIATHWSYDRVTAYRMQTTGGRGGPNGLEPIYLRALAEKEVAWPSREIAKVLKRYGPTVQVLVATHKFTESRRVDRGANIPAQLMDDLKRLAREPGGEAVHPERVSIATYGTINGRNTWSSYRVCIMLGLPHRDLERDLAPTILGQLNDLEHAITLPGLHEVRQSECAATFQQTANRIRCREVEGGHVKAADLYLFHWSSKIEPLVAKSMPGMTWKTWAPQFAPVRQAAAQARASVALAKALANLSADVQAIRPKELYTLAGLIFTSPTLAKKALDQTLESEAGRSWMRNGIRGKDARLVRVTPAAFGFQVG